MNDVLILERMAQYVSAQALHTGNAGYNSAMKILLFLLSALAVALTWWRLNSRQNRPAFGQRLKNAATGIMVGIAVYFGLMLLAMLYLMATTA